MGAADAALYNTLKVLFTSLPLVLMGANDAALYKNTLKVLFTSLPLVLMGAADAALYKNTLSLVYLITTCINGGK